MPKIQIRVVALQFYVLAGIILSSAAIADATDDLFLVVRDAYTAGFGPRVEGAINAGADVNATDSNGYSPLQIALANYFIMYEMDAVEVLLESGADPNRRTPSGKTALEIVASGQIDPMGEPNLFLDAALLLIDAGADIEATTSDGDTPLIMFSRIGAARIIHALIDSGANVNRKNSEGVSAWDAAEGNVEITRALENAGSAIDPERQRQMERRPFEFFHDFGQESGPADPLVESVIYMGEWQVLTNPLEGKDLRGITSSQLRNLRNTIFARHGHSFRSQDLREHYENFEWYEPQSGDVSALLTDSEKRNVAIIQEIERGIGGRDSNDSRDMRLQSPLGYTIEMGYASTGETYEFYLDSVTVYGSRVDRGTWRMADRYILIEWNTGKRERIDWLHLQNNESIHYSIDTIEGM